MVVWVGFVGLKIVNILVLVVRVLCGVRCSCRSPGLLDNNVSWKSGLEWFC